MNERRELFLGGVPFTIDLEARLTSFEKEYISRFTTRVNAWKPDNEPGSSPFRITLKDLAPREGRLRTPSDSPQPASLQWTSDRLVVSHESFHAELDPRAAVGRLFRNPEADAGLPLTLRIALKARLPFAGGVPLHAAAVVVDRRAIVFCGPSGAGKSTLAASAPFTVLSDEMIAIAGSPFRAFGTGHWGTLGERPCPSEGFEVAALMELGKGDELRIDPMPAAAAFRRLMAVLLVPMAAPLWEEALGVLARLTRTVPVYRMEWTKDRDPWPSILTRIGLSSDVSQAITNARITQTP